MISRLLRVLVFAIVIMGGVMLLPRPGPAGLSIPIAAGAADETAPSLVTFDLSPTTIDVSTTAQTVTLTAAVADDVGGSGVSGSSYIAFYAPVNPYTVRSQWILLRLDDAHRISGTAQDGVYQRVATVPAFSAAGLWKADTHLFDTVGNERWYSDSAMSGLGFPSALNVISPNEDIQPPVLAAFDFSPKAVDVSFAPQTVMVSVRLIDGPAGAGTWVQASSPSAVIFQSPSGQQGLSAILNGASPTTGSAQDGTYQVPVTIPLHAEAGTWTVQTAILIDTLLNQANLTTAQVSALGFPTTFEVTSASADTTAPVLAAFDFSPKVLNNSASRAINFSAHITDDLSGVRTGVGVTSQVSFRSPSGLEFVHRAFDGADRSSGTLQDANFAALESILPIHSQTGTWHLAQFILNDQAGNQVELSESQVAALGFPTTFEVVAGQASISVCKSLEDNGDSVDQSGAFHFVVESGSMNGATWSVVNSTDLWISAVEGGPVPCTSLTISDGSPMVHVVELPEFPSNWNGNAVSYPKISYPDPVTVSAWGLTTGVIDGAAFIFRNRSVAAPPAAKPVVTSISPASGPVTGGTEITISGQGLADATFVDFDGTQVLPSSKTDTQLKVMTPSHAAGIVHVIVHTATSESDPTDSCHFRYLDPPTVTSVVPNQGSAAGGTSVTIHGTNLDGAFEVRFGDAPVAPSQVTETAVVVTAPSHAAGMVHIRVRTSGGLSATSPSDQFTFVSGAPVVTGVAPSSGTTAGGTVVTVTGTGLAGATSVRFGDRVVAPDAVTDTNIVVAAPSHGAGTVHIQVVTPRGTSAATAADQFAYVAGIPLVLQVSPRSGPVEGGTLITITGTGLTGALSVHFGTSPIVPTVVSDTSLQVVAPPHAAGLVHLLVTTPIGTSVETVLDDYTYGGGGPRVLAISPTSGPTSGGTVVTISGTGFAGAAGVVFGETIATPSSVTNTQVTVVSPAHTAGVVHLRVVTPGGVSPETALDDFTYGGPPVVLAISPKNGSVDGGTVIEVTGGGFTGATTVRFGDVAVAPFSVGENQLRVVAPAAGAAGTVHIRVTTSFGTSLETSADTFTYVAHPAVTGVSPKTGSTRGGTLVVISGVGFTGTTTVSFGTVGVVPTAVTDSEIRVVAPAHPAALVHLRIVSSGGRSPDTTNDDFTFVEPGAGVCTPLTLWVNDPNYGNAAGGFYWDPVSGQVWTAERGWHAFSPVPARPSPQPLWVDDLTYGNTAGGFYWDPVSGLVWTALHGWHPYSPIVPPPTPLWVSDPQYGSPGGGFYWDPVSGLVWTAQRGWHAFAPVPARIAAQPLWVNDPNYGSAGGGFYWDPQSGQVWTPERGWHPYGPQRCLAP